MSFKFDMNVGQIGLVSSCILFVPGVSRYVTCLVVQLLGFLPGMEFVSFEFLRIRRHCNTVPLHGVN